MNRLLYRSMLELHPRAFRERYAGEMLLIFEEAAPLCGSTRLLADAGTSLLRQWLRNPLVWTVTGAVIGGFIPVLLAASMMNPTVAVRKHRLAQRMPAIHAPMPPR